MMTFIDAVSTKVVFFPFAVAVEVSVPEQEDRAPLAMPTWK